IKYILNHVQRYRYRWNRWNVEHIGEHGISVEDAQFVVDRARPPYPQQQADRFLVIGQTGSGAYIQVAYVFDPPGVIYVIHARPLTDKEKRRYRRRRN